MKVAWDATFDWEFSVQFFSCAALFVSWLTPAATTKCVKEEKPELFQDVMFLVDKDVLVMRKDLENWDCLLFWLPTNRKPAASYNIYIVCAHFQRVSDLFKPDKTFKIGERDLSA
jgi:hypothetical protein